MTALILIQAIKKLAARLCVVIDDDIFRDPKIREAQAKMRADSSIRTLFMDIKPISDARTAERAAAVIEEVKPGYLAQAWQQHKAAARN